MYKTEIISNDIATYTIVEIQGKPYKNTHLYEVEFNGEKYICDNEVVRVYVLDNENLFDRLKNERGIIKLNSISEKDFYNQLVEAAKKLNIINMKTLGESRVRTEFNPSNKSYVDEIKQKSAELINLINEAAAKLEWNDETFKEFMRLKALAMTSYEEAAMWAVKAATI